VSSRTDHTYTNDADDTNRHSHLRSRQLQDKCICWGQVLQPVAQ
jgi:hypothetical protein